MSGLFEMMRKTQEAQAVRLGLPIDRQYTDAELADSKSMLADVERELYGPLSDDELAFCDQNPLIPFCVTVTTAQGVEQISILAPHSAAATIQVVEMLFGELDSDKPESFKLKVEPLQMQQRDLLRAA